MWRRECFYIACRKINCFCVNEDGKDFILYLLFSLFDDVVVVVVCVLGFQVRNSLKVKIL